MSTEGTATVAAGAAVVAGGAAVVVGEALVGAGILIAQGIMWCGRKMEENVQKAQKEWEAQKQAAFAASRANIEDIPHFIAGQAERIAAVSSSLTLDISSAPFSVPTSNPEMQAQFAATMAQVRTALADARSAAHMQREAEQETLASHLRAEIAASRGLLPPELISRSEAALQATPQEMRAALHDLEANWRAISDGQAQALRQERQARLLLRSVLSQLLTVETMLHNAGTATAAMYKAQTQEIANRIAAAQNLVESDVPAALQSTSDIQQAVRGLLQTLASATQREWEQTRRQGISWLGTLDALSRMLQDARSLKLVEEARISALQGRIGRLQQTVDQVVHQSSPSLAEQTALLEQQIVHLKTEVFRIVKTKQQRQIADIVATTLGELGFQAGSGGKPVALDNGKSASITATRGGQTPGFQRDDKVVSFTISQEGAITYDFSGYVGDSCLSEAKEIFGALQAKGIFLLDDDALQVLNRLPAERLTPATLSQARLRPQLVQNKAQAHLAEQLKEIFGHMNFTTVRESVVGGHIDIEAFNGEIGYHVILPPTGPAEVFKNHVDVSKHPEDEIVGQLTQATAAAPRGRETRRKRQTGAQWDAQQDRHMLEDGL
jgi:hypothetical protein